MHATTQPAGATSRVRTVAGPRRATKVGARRAKRLQRKAMPGVSLRIRSSRANTTSCANPPLRRTGAVQVVLSAPFNATLYAAHGVGCRHRVVRVVSAAQRRLVVAYQRTYHVAHNT